MRKLMTFARLIAVVSVAAGMLAGAAAAPVSAADTKTFFGEKICRLPFVTVSPPNPGGYCLITQANFKVLLGAKDYYTNPLVTRSETGALLVLSSPVTIRAVDKRHSTAQGHCTYNYPNGTHAGHGICEFWSGTGRLDGFHARFMVGSPTPIGVTVTGPYWFERGHEDAND